jgi:membrane-associated protein
MFRGLGILVAGAAGRTTRGAGRKLDFCGPPTRYVLRRGLDRPHAHPSIDGSMQDFFDQIWNLLVTFANPKNLRHPEVYVEALKQPGVMWAAFVAVNVIIFTETGLLIGFLLPGDSLLVVTGIVAHAAGWPLVPLVVSLCVAAIVGDTVGYAIGAKAGPAIFNRPQSRFFKRDHLLAAKAYYEKHGGKTIIIARFIPLIRTFVPVVAGAAKMEYRSFLMFNVFGGIGWIVSMIMIGYSLDPILRQFLGEDFQIAKHIDKVVILVVFLSILPLLTKGYQHYRAKRATKNGAAKE